MSLAEFLVCLYLYCMTLSPVFTQLCRRNFTVHVITFDIIERIQV